jgi:hypothetical protein
VLFYHVWYFYIPGYPELRIWTTKSEAERFVELGYLPLFAFEGECCIWEAKLYVEKCWCNVGCRSMLAQSKLT